VLPILAAGGLAVGRDFYLAYSPERVDPGNARNTAATIPKLVGGLDEASLELAAALYGAAVAKVVSVSSCEVAEAAKILENTYRAVNIALVNELKNQAVRLSAVLSRAGAWRPLHSGRPVLLELAGSATRFGERVHRAGG
jgi:UDP-N-acetyl-D-mannosaminuronate dehydrogenase